MERAEIKNFITPFVYETVGTAFNSLKLSDAWRGKVRTQEGVSKEDKEALNLIFFVILAVEMKVKVNYTAIFAMQLKRLLRKAYTWDAKPSNKKFLEENFEDFKGSIEDYVVKRMLEKNGVGFVLFLDKASKVTEEEQRVYNAAKAIATLIEYEDEKSAMVGDVAEETRKGVVEELARYKDIDIVRRMEQDNDPLKKLFKKISWARYIFRWQGYTSNVRCSILTHMLETSILGWLMAIEKGDLKLANEAGLVGLFHDVAEIWTDDIPSPAKDGIINHKGVSLRKIAEQQELVALEEYFYPCLSEHAKEFFKNGIMLEDIEDKEKKAFFKAADYFSADLEVWWNIKAGARDKKYKKVLRGSLKKKRTPSVDKLVRKMNFEITRSVFL